MDTSVKKLTTYGRAEFIRVFSLVARGIDAKYLHDPDKIFIVAIEGGLGKSLVADAIATTWMSPRENGLLCDLPLRDHMMFEYGPMDAAHRPFWRDTDIAGKKTRLAFSSAQLSDRHDYAKIMRRAFNDIEKPNGALLASQVNRGFYDACQGFVSLTLDILGETGDGISRYLTLTAHNDELLNDPRFQAYWNQLDEFNELDERKKPVSNPLERVLAFPQIKPRPSMLP